MIVGLALMAYSPGPRMSLQTRRYLTSSISSPRACHTMSAFLKKIVGRSGGLPEGDDCQMLD
jgi:hypothetical protein